MFHLLVWFSFVLWEQGGNIRTNGRCEVLFTLIECSPWDQNIGGLFEVCLLTMRMAKYASLHHLTFQAVCVCEGHYLQM